MSPQPPTLLLEGHNTSRREGQLRAFRLHLAASVISSLRDARAATEVVSAPLVQMANQVTGEVPILPEVEAVEERVVVQPSVQEEMAEVIQEAARAALIRAVDLLVREVLAVQV
jgi:hypothetical protein